MTISKLINSGISFIGKNHANIDKFAKLTKTKKFDVKSLGDAALFLPFGWQVKGLIWVGTRVYATYVSSAKETAEFEDITQSLDPSVAVLNSFLTEAVMTNVHTARFHSVGGYVQAQHTRDTSVESWDQTQLTQDFANDFVNTLFKKVYVVGTGDFNRSVSQSKDLKLTIGSDSIRKDLLVRVTYSVVSEDEFELLVKIYVVEEGEIVSSHVNVELDQTDIEELIEVLQTKKESNSVIDSVIRNAKESLENVQEQVGKTYTLAKNKTIGFAAGVAIRGAMLYPQVVNKAHDLSDTVTEKASDLSDTVTEKALDLSDTVVSKAEKVTHAAGEQLTKALDGLSGFIKGKLEKTEAKVEEPVVQEKTPEDSTVTEVESEENKKDGQA